MTGGPTTENGPMLLSKRTMAVTPDWQPGGKMREEGSPQGLSFIMTGLMLSSNYTKFQQNIQGIH